MRFTVNAKLNLTLDIVGNLPNGFHALRSVMVPVSLNDFIDIEPAEELTFCCDNAALNTSDNLCVRAAKAFFDRSGIKPEVSIKLQKNIPFGAGLGGGSADAAVTLKGLNEYFGCPLEMNVMFELAESLGSDVPFCLLDKPALCEGRGEVLTPISGVESFFAVVAIGRSRLSTPDVYREYDTLNPEVRNDTDIFLEAVKTNNTEKMIASMGNAFEAVTDILAPETKALRETLLALGAKTARLSGSGSSVYGIFADEENALSACKTLDSQDGVSAWLCKTLN